MKPIRSLSKTALLPLALFAGLAAAGAPRFVSASDDIPPPPSIDNPKIVKSADDEVSPPHLSAPDPSAGDWTRLGNVYLEKNAFSAAVNGIAFLDVLSKNVTLPVIGSIVGSYDWGVCGRFRKVVEALQAPGLRLRTSACKDKRQPLKDLARGNVWRFLAPKARFGFTTDAEITVPEGVKSIDVQPFLPVHGNQQQIMRACTEIADLLRQLDVTADQVSKDRTRLRKRPVKFLGTCAYTKYDYIKFSVKVVLD